MSQERLGGLREPIAELEQVKDEIIGLLEGPRREGAGTYALWISDAREVTCNVVAAWQLLAGAASGQPGLEPALRDFLGKARSAQARVESELRNLGDRGAALNERLRARFLACQQGLIREMNVLFPEQKTEAPRSTVVQVSSTEIHLCCAVCGKSAAVFRYVETQGKRGLLYRGLTHEVGLGEGADALFALLEAGKLSEAHERIQDHPCCSEGMDAYCPECDKVYCYRHYNPVEEFDDGFYDCTWGTCPAGHRRMIDD